MNPIPEILDLTFPLQFQSDTLNVALSLSVSHRRINATPIILQPLCSLSNYQSREQSMAFAAPRWHFALTGRRKDLKIAGRGRTHGTMSIENAGAR